MTPGGWSERGGGAHPGSDVAAPLRQHHIPEGTWCMVSSSCPGAAALSLVVNVGMQGQGGLVPPQGGTATQSSMGGRGGSTNKH